VKFLNFLKPQIKVNWWRLEGSEHGNFGDEITREIIAKVFGRRVVWTPADQCDMIGAGSIIEETLQNKGSNRPYVWSSGFIQQGDLTISDSDFKVIGVRGKESLKRVVGDTTNITIGDAGLLASYLIEQQPKKHRLGILPHYVDIDSPVLQEFLKNNPEVHLIDATWPCKKVIEEIAKCEAVLSSSLHGLIVSDSLHVPSIHLKLSDKLKGGEYKFNDYYSIYSQSRYNSFTIDILSKPLEEVIDEVQRSFIPVDKNELQSIKKSIIDSFPFK